MNAKDAIKLVEGEAPEGWSVARGVYANLSRWPHEVQYYVKCPKCGLVHGDFKSMREANSKKLCDLCNLEAINKLKAEIVKVVDEPDHKPKEMAKLVGEAAGETFDPFDAPAQPSPVPVPPEDEPVAEPADTMGEVDRLLLGNWVDVALRRFAEDQNHDLSDMVIDERWSERKGEYDAQNPENTRFFKLEVGGEEWLVFKDDNQAYTYALELVTNDLHESPELFTKSWIQGFVNTEKLAAQIGDPYEEWENEIRDLDYAELLDKMVEEDYVESDDPIFFAKNGNSLRDNKKRTAVLNVYMEDYIEKEKPTIDPWQWLEDVYGEEEAASEAVKLAGIDYEAAAKSAVKTDGWPHFVARHDGNSHELENGVVYCRIN